MSSPSPKKKKTAARRSALSVGALLSAVFAAAGAAACCYFIYFFGINDFLPQRARVTAQILCALGAALSLVLLRACVRPRSGEDDDAE